MKDRECIHCKKFWDCEGKPTRSPCVCFEKRGDEIDDRGKEAVPESVPYARKEH